MASGKTALDCGGEKNEVDVAYLRGKSDIIAQHKLQCAHTHLDVGRRLPTRLNITSS